MTSTARLAAVLALMFVVITNFLVFVGIASQLGGDAFNGKVVGDHYFLGSHGQFTETSAAVYHYSQCHAVSVLVTIPLTMIAMAFVVFTVMPELMTMQKRR